MSNKKPPHKTSPHISLTEQKFGVEMEEFREDDATTPPEWISVNDRLPAPKTQCKAKTKDGVDNTGEAYYDGSKWWYAPIGSDSKFRLKEDFVTHWMSLSDSTTK